ncbi:MAG: hypothetical protein K2O18_19740, partial [Oscillospiraceae bacterium]|nr:hypothetical protein [Oscillospiraceae bacterium]
MENSTEKQENTATQEGTEKQESTEKEKQEPTKNKRISWAYTMQEETGDNGDSLSYAWIYCKTKTDDIDDLVNRYIFEVRRYKITATKEEYLNVKVYEV